MDTCEILQKIQANCDILKEIEQALDIHRAEVQICCDETCFCWDVEETLMKHKEKEEV